MKKNILINLGLLLVLNTYSQSYIPHENNNANLKYVSIDTNRHFKRIVELSKYKNYIDSLVKVLSTHYKGDTFLIDSIEHFNSINFSILLYRFLDENAKDQIEYFNFLSFIANNYSIFSEERLLELYYKYPGSYIKSKKGVEIHKMIMNRPKNVGKDFLLLSKKSIFSNQGNKKKDLVDILQENNRSYTLFEFTASWCTHCIFWTQMNIEKIKEREKEGKISFVCLSIDAKPSNWWKSEGKKHLSYVISNEGNDLLKNLNNKGIPHFLLVDNNSGIIKRESAGNDLASLLNL